MTPRRKRSPPPNARFAARAPDPYRMPGHMPCMTTPIAMATIGKNRRDRRERKENPVWSFLRALCVLCGFFFISLHAQDRPVSTAVWAPKPSQPPAYPAGLKPWTKIADLKAKHKGDANWRETVVDDGRLTGEYVAAAPRTKV